MIVAALTGDYVKKYAWDTNLEIKNNEGRYPKSLPFSIQPQLQQMKPDYVPRGMQFAVLRAVGSLGLNASGVAIRELIERNTGLDVPAAQIYVALQRLEDRKLVTSAVEANRPAGRRGQPRRIYELSASGLRSLEAGLRLFGNPTLHTGAEDEEVGRGAKAPSRA
jgi:DNA-binding PadR family transcriptional regulator